MSFGKLNKWAELGKVCLNDNIINTLHPAGTG